MTLTIILDDKTAEGFQIAKDLLKTASGIVPKDDNEMMGYLIMGLQECIQYQMKEAGLINEIKRSGKAKIPGGIAG